ncbi:MAG: site-specific integrase [Dehalococcoidales bacterium]
MKVLEVYKKVVDGKRISDMRKRSYKNAFDSLARYTEEFPVDATVVNGWINSMPETYSDETVLTYWKALGAACKFLQKALGRDSQGNFRFFNPVTDSERPRVKKKQRRYLKAGAVLDFMKQGRGKDDLMISSVIVSSACRIGDLEGLKGQDVGDDSFVSPRGKTGELVYRCDSRLCTEMKRMAGSPDGYVFKAFQDNSRPMTRGVMAKKVRRMMHRSGLTGKKLGPHTIRHSVASMVAIKTGSGLAVQQMLNQESLKTAQIYIHDAEKIASKGIDTLAMVNVSPVEQTALVPVVVDDNIVETTDLMEEMFEAVPRGVKVRPLLGERELGIIRSVMIDFARGYRGDNRVYDCQELLKRMLRKVKHE